MVAPEKGASSSMTMYSAKCLTMQYQSNSDVIVELREAEAAYKALPNRAWWGDDSPVYIAYYISNNTQLP